ncbi:MAG: hypothetical protein R3B84_17285 [Zavarzinella sp.]
MNRLLVLLAGLWTVSAQSAEIEVWAKGLMAPFGMDYQDKVMVIAEYKGHRILAITPDGKVTTIAGSPKVGTTDGPAAEALFNQPHNVVVGNNGLLYVADTMNHTIRVIDTSKKTVATLAGSEKGFAGDGGSFAEAKFNQAYHVALSADKNTLYLADLGNRRIRALDLVKKTVTTVVGNGQRGVPADGTEATKAPLMDPRAVTVDAKGNIWILERGGHCLRVVENGKIRTVAGNGKKAGTGDGGPALQASMDGPKFLWVEASGNILIADTENHIIRRVVVKDGTIQRIAGTGKKGTKVGPSWKEVELNQPHGVSVGPDGLLYIADSTNNRVLRGPVPE